MNEDRVRPFSQGTQMMDWMMSCCDACRKEDDCPLRRALVAAYCDDGTISREIADRLGVPANTWSDWTCREFELPRPEGVVRIVPAPGQLSLFRGEA